MARARLVAGALALAGLVTGVVAAPVRWAGAAEPPPGIAVPGIPRPRVTGVSDNGRYVAFQDGDSLRGGRYDRRSGRVVLVEDVPDVISGNGRYLYFGETRYDVETGARVSYDVPYAPPSQVSASAATFDGEVWVMGGSFVADNRAHTLRPIATFPIETYWHLAVVTSISDDGRFVAFLQQVNLDTDRCWVDGFGATVFVFGVYDRATGGLERMPVGTDSSGCHLSASGVISGNGRYLLWSSSRPERVTGTAEVFLRDRVTGTTTNIRQQIGLGQTETVGDVLDLSDDGGRILFTPTSDRYPRETEAVLVDVGRWARTPLWHASRETSRPRLSGDGSVVVWDDGDSTRTIGAMVVGEGRQARLEAGEELAVPVASQAGPAPAGAAALLNVTVTNPVASGYLTVWPCGTPRPWASNVNFAAGATVANAVVAQPGADGSVCLVSNVGVDAVVDLAGWLRGGDLYNSVGPTRWVDTREGRGGVRLRGGQELGVSTARDGVSSTATAVALNVTVTQPAGGGFVTVWPCGTPRPWASNLNFATNQTVANLVFAKVGADDRVCAWSNVDIDLVVDVSGYFGASGVYEALVPQRLLDTRIAQEGAPRVPAGQVTMIPLTAPGSGGAAVLNVTATNPVSSGFVTVWPCGSPRPWASSVNFARDQTVANAVIAEVDASGSSCLWSNVAVDLVVDLNGRLPVGADYDGVGPVRLVDTRS